MSEGIKKLNEQTIKELGVSTESDVEGGSFTAYGLQPTQFLKEVVNAAKKQLYFANFVTVMDAPKGVKDVSIPKRTHYMGEGGVTYGSSEPENSDISVTDLTNLDSVTATPSIQVSGVALSNKALQTNALNLVETARDELSYSIGDKIDKKIAETIGDASNADSSNRGAQLIFGGDATGDDSLAEGDIMTTDLVAKAAKYLKSTTCKYWSGGSEETSSESKNPWMNDGSDPFVLFIGPSQEMAFRQSSQFTNASEYGDRSVIQNGEIGSYLGIRIVVTNNVEGASSGDTGPDGNTAGTDMTRCILMKPKKACALVYGRRPQMKVFDYPQRDQTWVTMVTDYDIKIIHEDAIVKIDVANE